ncbi:hypothetical protein F6W69_06340 [Microbacterium oxydans]|uniref:hypothetical protein n=1 Tax=Microbacterium oxydans TaxID=82380 RepID=UPI0011425E18|nr:hypothetical protein [Microbacterium oxydans]KAB1893639.1 hypothetical protein F6W69_06340 [Microbacterium oxydans]
MELQDWLDTVLEYLKVFAWPAVVLILALVYRKPLIEVLRRLHKAAGFGATVELEKGFEQSARSLNEANLPELVAETRESVDPSADTPELKEPETPSREEIPDPMAELKRVWSPAAIRNFWESNPETAARLGLVYPDDDRHPERYGRMMLAWAHLEARATKLGMLIGLPPSSARNLGVLSAGLLDRKLISHESAEIARSLQRLRNELAHEVENINISASLTSNFVQAAEKLDTVFAHLTEDLEDAAEI